MLKHLGTLLFIGFVALLPGTHSTAQSGDDMPTKPLYSTVFLKPGETQQLVLSAPEFKIGGGGRSVYYFTPINEVGEKTPPIKGIAIADDRKRMDELVEHFGDRYVALRFSAAADAEPGKYLIRVRATAMGVHSGYEARVRVTVSK